MKIEVTKTKSPQKEKIDTDFLTEAIQSHIGKSNFPRKIELNRIVATKAYYDEKLKRHDSILSKSQDELSDTEGKLSDLKHKCMTLLRDLKNSI